MKSQVAANIVAHRMVMLRLVCERRELDEEGVAVQAVVDGTVEVGACPGEGRSHEVRSRDAAALLCRQGLCKVVDGLGVHELQGEIDLG